MKVKLLISEKRGIPRIGLLESLLGFIIFKIKFIIINTNINFEIREALLYLEPNLSNRIRERTINTISRIEKKEAFINPLINILFNKTINLCVLKG